MVKACVKKTCRSICEEGKPYGGYAGRARQKFIGQTIKRDLDFKGLSLDMIHDRTLMRRFIHLANPT